MFIIEKSFSFSSSHQLVGLSPEHPCSRLHGHNYGVTLTLKKTVVDDTGFVYDYRRLENVKQWIDAELDHRHLNDVLKFNPTAELIAKFIYEQWAGTIEDLASVTVKETDKTAATYEPYLIQHKTPIFTR